MVEPCTAWVPQLCSSKMRRSGSGRDDGRAEHELDDGDPVVRRRAHSVAVLAVFVVFAVFAALAVPGASSPASDTIAARTDINSRVA